ncbi:MAG: pyruvoyl-dependent arginine decarboxylase [Bacteroidota bacterium]
MFNSNLMVRTPNAFALVRGAAEGPQPLNAFDNALMNAGIGDTNLVKMSSILPPGASQVAQFNLPMGGLVPVAYASIERQQPGMLISSAVAVGIPKDPSQSGVIMEHHGVKSLDDSETIVRQMVKDAFDYRNRPLMEIQSIGIEHTVERCGAAFAAVVLWYI